jgi:hypothetical protein
MNQTNEEKARNYIEGLKLKLHAAILSAKGEAIACKGDLFTHHSAIAKALTEFGIDTGLIEEHDLLLKVGIEEEKNS